ncbi:hypothetical protein [Niabella drilacis]|uniref:PEGA domain-containing protein n=1 Tax=Niabella drilacis (strain DSM 25811 / CCM 8410 / CCUG 62505 / LMG 26954 / E90) TaxID=1285928 RepID=A0A1G6N0Y4_NIADE|nr:hypothetical protein [Niabella drilacis]SDC61361.1 hypothetical protein SAMN04487894_103107 [Niabella drilacis]
MTQQHSPVLPARASYPGTRHRFSGNGIPVIAAALLFQSCATILSGSRQSVTIRTNVDSTHIVITRPSGKQVFSGNTPAAVKLKRGAGYFKKAAYLVTLSADGYQNKQVPVRFRLNGVYFGNALIGGLVGLIVIDPLTGAMWTTKTGEINEVLDPE